MSILIQQTFSKLFALRIGFDLQVIMKTFFYKNTLFIYFCIESLHFIGQLY